MKLTQTPLASRILPAVALLLLSLETSPGATVTWQGGLATDFTATATQTNQALNWSGAALPTAGDNVVFDETLLNTVARTINTTGGLSTQTLTFDAMPQSYFGSKGAQTFARGYAYSIGSQGGTTFALGTPSLTQNGAGAILYSSNLIFGAGNPAINFDGSGSGLLTVAQLSTANTAANVTTSKFGASHVLLTSTNASNATSHWVLRGGTVRFTNELSFSGVAPASFVPDYFTLNGGALRDNNLPGTATTTVTLNANRGILLGDAVLTGTGTIEVAGVNETMAYAGIMADNGTGADNFAKGGRGTFSLFGPTTSTYTGSTEVRAGTLRLDFATNNVAKINAASSLILSGGTLSVAGNAAGASAQQFAGLSVKDSVGGIAITTGSNQNATLDVGAISRSGLGVVNVIRTNTGSGVASLRTTNANVAGTLGGYIAVSTNDWAKNDGAGNLVALAAGDYATAPAAGVNLRVDATTAAVTTNINSLKLNVATGTGNLTFNAGDVLTIDTGGIISANTANIGTAVGTGSITSGNGSDLIFFGANATTVNAVIADNGTTPIGLTVNRTATLTLAAANTNSGPLTVHQGTVTASNANALQNVTSIVLGTSGAGAGGAGNPATANLTLTAAGTVNVGANLTLRAGNGGNASVSAQAVGQTLNLNGNIAIELYDPERDIVAGTIFTHALRNNSRVTIGGATPDAQTISGSSTANSNAQAIILTNAYGFGGNLLAGGITDLKNALVINSQISNGVAGGTLSLRLDSRNFSTNFTPGLAVAVLNGNNSYTGGGIDLANASISPGTTIESTIVLVGTSTALGSGPVQFGRSTGAVIPGDARGGVLTNGNLTIGNNFNIVTGSTNPAGTFSNPGTGYSMLGGNTATNSTYTGRVSFGGSLGFYFRGLGYTADNTFATPTAALFTTGVGYGTNPALVLSQVAGGRTTLTGAIASDGFANNVTDHVTNGTGSLSHQVIIASGGEVKLSSEASDYSGRTIVRNGTLLVGANAPAGGPGALGSSTQPVLLGDSRTAFSGANVRVATNAAFGGTATFNATGGSNGNGLITWTAGFAANEQAWDGVGLAVNDLVLVKDQDGAMIVGASAVANNTTGNALLAPVKNAAVNGIYRVLNTGATTAQFERVADVIRYGTYVNVTAGITWGGKRLYQSYGGPDQPVALNHSPLAWNIDDTSYTPGLLTDGAVTVGRDIAVVSTEGGATSLLGGNSNDDSVFTGAISLAKDVTFTSVATGGKSTTFSGAITESGGSFTVTKTGAGLVNLNGPQNYSILHTTAGTTNIDGSFPVAGTSTVNADADVNFGVSETLAALHVGGGVVATLGPTSPPAPAPGLADAAAGLMGSPTAVPEPGLGMTLLAGLGVLLGLRRRV